MSDWPFLYEEDAINLFKRTASLTTRAHGQYDCVPQIEENGKPFWAWQVPTDGDIRLSLRLYEVAFRRWAIRLDSSQTDVNVPLQLWILRDDDFFVTLCPKCPDSHKGEDCRVEIPTTILPEYRTTPKTIAAYVQKVLAGNPQSASTS